MKMSTKRTLTAVGVLAAVGVGLAFHTGTGTPSAWGLPNIAAICPLGAIEAAIASKTIVPPLFLGLLIVVALVALFGRAFCSWGCPVPLLRRLGGKGSKGKKAKEPAAVQDAKESAANGFLAEPAPPERGGTSDPRNWALGATVLATAAFGFPVFCLICPVGLTVATFVGLWHLFQFSEATLSLVVFPLVLVLELVFLRRWCHRFCPLGALLSLGSRLNRTFRPTVDQGACLSCSGASCHQCATVCPEGIDLHHPQASAPLNECVKCGECAQACPAQAIHFPFLASGARKRQAEAEVPVLPEEPCDTAAAN